MIFLCSMLFNSSHTGIKLFNYINGSDNRLENGIVCVYFYNKGNATINDVPIPKRDLTFIVPFIPSMACLVK